MPEKKSIKSKIEHFLAIASILVPILLVYVGHIYKETEAKRGIHEKYVEIAIKVLQKPGNSKDLELRKWALQILNEYSEVPIHLEAQEHILSNGLCNKPTILPPNTSSESKP